MNFEPSTEHTDRVRCLLILLQGHRGVTEFEAYNTLGTNGWFTVGSDSADHIVRGTYNHKTIDMYKWRYRRTGETSWTEIKR